MDTPKAPAEDRNAAHRIMLIATLAVVIHGHRQAVKRQKHCAQYAKHISLQPL